MSELEPTRSSIANGRTSIPSHELVLSLTNQQNKIERAFNRMRELDDRTNVMVLVGLLQELYETIPGGQFDDTNATAVSSIYSSDAVMYGCSLVTSPLVLSLQDSSQQDSH